MNDDDEEILGLIDYLAVEWPGGHVTGEGFGLLLDLVNRDVIRVLDLELDLIQREVTRSGKPLRLTSQEFALLEFLCRNAGRVVTRSMILERVWGMRIEPKTNVVDVHMSRLRAKVDGGGRKPLIGTMRGMGYVLRNA